MANEVKIIGQCIEGIKAEAETIEEMISQLDYDILQANDQIDILEEKIDILEEKNYKLEKELQAWKDHQDE